MSGWRAINFDTDDEDELVAKLREIIDNSENPGFVKSIGDGEVYAYLSYYEQTRESEYLNSEAVIEEVEDLFDVAIAWYCNNTSDQGSAHVFEHTEDGLEKTYVREEFGRGFSVIDEVKELYGFGRYPTTMITGDQIQSINEETKTEVHS